MISYIIKRNEFLSVEKYNKITKKKGKRKTNASQYDQEKSL